MGFTINQIIILHSLAPDERPTWEEVASQIKYAALKLKYPEIVQMIRVPDRQSLFTELEGIKQHTTRWLKPLLHLEMHGSPDGLALVDESEIIPWQDLKEPIREINIAAKNNLFVSLATCYGGHFLSLYECDKPCPFYGYVGPMGEVTDRDLENSFSIFFRELLEGTSVPLALFELQKSLLTPSGQGRFAFTNCEEYFDKLVKVHNAQTNNGQIMEDWLNDLMTKGRKLFPDVPDETLRKVFEFQLRSSHLNNIVARWREIFFHRQPYVGK